MSTKKIEKTSKTLIVETVEKTPWEKGWDTRRKKKIAAQQEQLEEQKRKNSELKKENRQLKRESKK